MEHTGGMKTLASILLVLILSYDGFSHTTSVKKYLTEQVMGQEYRIRPLVNGAIIIGGVITDYYGVRILKAKPGAPYQTVIGLSPADVNFFDRSASRQNPAVMSSSKKASDWLLDASIVLPVLLVFDTAIRKDALNTAIVYATTMMIMANAYAWGVGHIDRYRPYVYNTRESLAFRLSQGSRNSFYAGHVAATATATFFGAKVYQDYHPESRLVPYLYASAAIPPAIVGYYRYRAGYHFPSDIIAGFAAGTAMGILIPQVHKIKNKNLSFHSIPGGIGLTCNF
jgi:membrane-associated phospholipid phosphatase